jgi:long-chain fatty acid transport protein
MSNSFRLSLLATTVAALLSSQISHAAAFQLYEVGTPLNGTAGVGQAAIADDASTTYFNPAGMAFLPNSQVMLGTQMMLPYIHFSKSAGTTFAGTNGGNAGGLVPGADLYFVYHASPKVQFGFSMNAPYGGMLDYEDHWVGRYYVQQMVLYTVDFNPTMSYRINDWAAIGGGVTLEYANLYQTVALPLPGGVDGQATIKTDNFSPGFNIGALFTPTPKTKLGIAFRSQIIHNLSGSATFFNIASTPTVTTTITMPANVIGSIDQKLNDKWSVLGELGWSDWSSMKNTTLNVSHYSLTTPQNWHDTYRVGLGGRYQCSARTLLQAGLSLDSSPTSSSHRTPNLPMDRQVRFGLGLEYALLKGVKLGASYEYINFGNANIDNVTPISVLRGSYERNYANTVQASLNAEI